MGEAEITTNKIIAIHSHIITYGNAADEIVTERIRDEIETMWNEPRAVIAIQQASFQIVFRITAEIKKEISELEKLYEGSTTAAHEYGHTLGLEHPKDLDLRGKGVPGIMYPRGTLVDPQFQYDPSKPAGVTGGTMHPMCRKVFQQDIENLKL